MLYAEYQIKLKFSTLQLNFIKLVLEILLIIR